MKDVNSIVVVVALLTANIFADEIGEKFESRFSRLKLIKSERNHHKPSLEFVEPKDVNKDELTNEFWLNGAKKVVDEQLRKQLNTKKAKNIIFFLGDGMSQATVAATRVYLGGEEKKLSFEDFPFTANSRTYCVNKQVSDSACTSTAYLSGVKGMGSTIGLNAKATRKNCFDTMDNQKRTESIASWAMKAGKDAGLVTTTRVTHASPSGIYAHTAYRHWESNVRIEDDGCDSDYNDDITEQLVYGEVGQQLNVILGCGSRHFLNESFTEHGIAGVRTDGKNLIEDWKNMKPRRSYVTNREDLLNLDPSKVDQVLGLFDDSQCTYNLVVQRDGLQDVKPSLKDMTVKAIEILSKNDEGFFLFVEGGRIDHGHHENRAKYALNETAEFSKAIEAALAKVDIEETLIIVTADHSHSMTYSGYAPRGNDIFGNGGFGDDGLPYKTLSYSGGPGFYTHWKQTPGGGRVDVRTLDETPVNFRFPSSVPLVEAPHSGEDVGIWAIGPWSHLFQGTIEQNAIPHILAYASCIGNGLKSCDA